MTVQNGPVIVAIVGGSGSGKSWLAQRLQHGFGGEAARVSLDSFYRDRSHLSLRTRERINFDHPRSIDWGCVAEFLAEVRRGAATNIPEYDFTLHARAGLSAWEPKPIVLFEGLWLLGKPALRSCFDLKVFLDVPAELRLRRRIVRDVAERGRTIDAIRRQFRTHVSPMHSRHVAPQKRWADRVLGARVGKREIDELAGAICKLRYSDSLGVLTTGI